MNASIEEIAKLNLEIKESIEKIKPVIEHLQCACTLRHFIPSNN
jgi:hypothetical protein